MLFASNLSKIYHLRKSKPHSPRTQFFVDEGQAHFMTSSEPSSDNSCYTITSIFGKQRKIDLPIRNRTFTTVKEPGEEKQKWWPCCDPAVRKEGKNCLLQFDDEIVKRAVLTVLNSWLQ